MRPFLAVYEQQYPLMGNPQVMAAKIVWDFAVYWGFLALQFLGGRLSDIELTDRSSGELSSVNHLNRRMQAFFREWDALDQQDWHTNFIDVMQIPVMKRLHYQLQDDLAGDAMFTRFVENLRLVESLAAAMFHEAVRILPEAPDRPINPYAISLDPRSGKKTACLIPGRSSRSRKSQPRR